MGNGETGIIWIRRRHNRSPRWSFIRLSDFDIRHSSSQRPIKLWVGEKFGYNCESSGAFLS